MSGLGPWTGRAARVSAPSTEVPLSGSRRGSSASPRRSCRPRRLARRGTGESSVSRQIEEPSCRYAESLEPLATTTVSRPSAERSTTGGVGTMSSRRRLQSSWQRGPLARSTPTLLSPSRFRVRDVDAVRPESMVAYSHPIGRAPCALDRVTTPTAWIDPERRRPIHAPEAPRPTPNEVTVLVARLQAETESPPEIASDGFPGVGGSLLTKRRFRRRATGERGRA